MLGCGWGVGLGSFISGLSHVLHLGWGGGGCVRVIHIWVTACPVYEVEWVGGFAG